jgi:hypothetical protein
MKKAVQHMNETVEKIKLTAFGAALAVGAMLSCDKEVLMASDAAPDTPVSDAKVTCDCPPAEPPLAGRYIVVSNVTTVQPGAVGGQSVVCPSGTLLISGGCTNTISSTQKMALLTSGPVSAPGAVPMSWSCDLQNNDVVAVTYRVSAICLRPPQ